VYASVFKKAKDKFSEQRLVQERVGLVQQLLGRHVVAGDLALGHPHRALRAALIGH